MEDPHGFHPSLIVLHPIPTLPVCPCFFTSWQTAVLGPIHTYYVPHNCHSPPLGLHLVHVVAFTVVISHRPALQVRSNLTSPSASERELVSLALPGLHRLVPTINADTSLAVQNLWGPDVVLMSE